MNIKETKDLIKTLFKLQQETGRRFSVELQSGPGLGKSESVRQVAEELGADLDTEFGYKPFFLSTLEQPDVRGFGLPAKDTDGTPAMVFTKAPWMPKSNEPKYGILFLDEFRQAGHDVQKPAAELLLNGAVGDSRLPITWMVVAASNRENDRSGVQRELAFISNRRMLITIEPHLDSWVEWAEKRGDIHWAAIAFAKRSPGDVFSDRVPDKSGPFCTPRTLVQMSYMIGKMPMGMFTEAAAGLVGQGTAAKFTAFLKVAEQIPEFEDIINDPKGTPVPDSERPDAQYAVMQMVAYRVDPDTAQQAFTYLTRLPKEFQVSGIKAALNRVPKIIQHQDVQGWLRQHKELILATNLIEKRR